ncbi:MAG TPA: 16S rRNA (cytidine(1402)-2'-O)-methyltransferase [Polyangiaceae bacterium]|nr:16S rRNA (cytidine(1402)-2'-O)-methyltransferase [Polyangiaceae bacterium]
MSGTLYVVSTPIGNLGDVSGRAAETLKLVERIAAEDTRRTRALLTHLGIDRKLLTKLDANVPERVVEQLVEHLDAGQNIALVTDAGTPSVSDPGAALVRRAAERGMTVVAIPGPSAVTAAVSVSGLVDGPFLFLGFLSRRGEKRKRAIRRMVESPEPVVLFEAPARIRATLAELAEAMPARKACILRELTKVHEEAVRGTLVELVAREVTERGEFTLVVEGKGDVDVEADVDIDALIGERLDAGDSPRTVADAISALVGTSRREIYARVLELFRARDPG